jgi:hypothetical protein
MRHQLREFAADETAYPTPFCTASEIELLYEANFTMGSAARERLYRETFARWKAITGDDIEWAPRGDYVPLGETKSARESIADAVAELRGEKKRDEPWEIKTLNQLKQLKNFGMGERKLRALVPENVDPTFRRRFFKLVDAVVAS